MKTTVDIADPLLLRAKALAAARQTTLREVIEDALREALAREQGRAHPSEITTRTFRGHGLKPGLSWDDWDKLHELAYEGRGG